MTERIRGFRGEFLWEWEIAERQLLQLAAAFNDTDLDWRPDASARAVREVFTHIACGAFMLLESLGAPPPADLYPDLPADPAERMWAFVRKNDALERSLRQREAIVGMLRLLFASARETITQMNDSDMERALQFFGETTTIRRVCLRLLAHTHEHMGQLIGYLRVCGKPAPWPDWRPDRR